MGTRAARKNRFLLWLLGLLLMALGVAGLLTGLGVLGDEASSALLVPQPVGDFFGDQGAWLWPVLAAVTVLLGLYGLRLLALQVVSDRLGSLDLTWDRSAGEVVLDTGAVTDALQQQVENFPGVAGTSARVVRQRRRTVLVLKVVATSRADIADLRRRLGEETLRDLHRALGDDLRWSVRVEIEPSSSGAKQRELV